MSRDTYSYDPQDRTETPATRTRRTEVARRSRSGQDRPLPPQPAQEISRSDSQQRSSEDVPRDQARRAYYVRDHAYLLRPSEVASLTDIGTFRVIAPDDLAKHVYTGDRDRMEGDIRRLKAQSLVTENTVAISGRKAFRVLTLTKAGKRLVRSANHVDENQALYHGLRKPREVKHDAALYRLYQKEAARIRNTGGTPTRVVLDYELKRDLNRDLARLDRTHENTEALEGIAEKHGLSVVDGKITVPDLRIEYHDANLEPQQVDLELATDHYRPRGLAAKSKAGFSLYSSAEDAPRLRRILNDQELTAKILSL
jgi:hypothetical protein